ncbi:MAG: lasso RiPP family leader peptide-containing protein [Thermoanaerobaculia bacterium]
MKSADNMPSESPKHEENPEGDSRKRPYSAPTLVSYGRLRDVTMGGSAGAGDSGMTSTTKKRP